jgi:hypothetical protein
MFWWMCLQAITGIITIVALVDAGMSKEEPYLVKIGFIGAFCATWIVGKVLDLLIYFQRRFDDKI